MVAFLFAIIAPFSVQFACAVTIQAQHQRSRTTALSGEAVLKSHDFNFYRKEPGVTKVAGTCRCPDGKEYPVGSSGHHDKARFSGGTADNLKVRLCSLACEHGMTTGYCKVSTSSSAETGDGQKVTCARKRNNNTGKEEDFIVENASKHLRWGGRCYCPSGLVTLAHDEGVACADVQCIGGLRGECGGLSKASGRHWKTRRGVVCAPARDETGVQLDFYRLTPDSVGSEGGTCTCPSGIVYKVGVVFNHFKNEYEKVDECTTEAGIACVGGEASKCQVSQGTKGVKGRAVRCAPGLRWQLEHSCTGVKLTDKNIGEKCWKDLWALAGCTAQAPAYDQTKSQGWFIDDVIEKSAWTMSDPKEKCYGKPSPIGNWHRFVPGVGQSSGTCKCPDGYVYYVGSAHGNCSQSTVLACEGGQQSACKPNTKTGSGMKVTCLPFRNSTDKTKPADWLREDQGVGTGGMGGLCSCPSGTKILVGGNDVKCQTLACEGGAPGECIYQGTKEKTSMKMTCLPPTAQNGTSTNWYQKDVFAVGFGGWGGTCTCPDGAVYKVGAVRTLTYPKCANDGCGKRNVPNRTGETFQAGNDCNKLACEGGISSTCDKTNDPLRVGRMAICRPATPSVPEAAKLLMALCPGVQRNQTGVVGTECWKTVWSATGCLADRVPRHPWLKGLSFESLVGEALRWATWPGTKEKWDCYGEAGELKGQVPVLNNLAMQATQSLMSGVMSVCFGKGRKSVNVGSACYQAMWTAAGCTLKAPTYTTKGNQNTEVTNGTYAPMPAVHETMTLEMLAATVIRYASSFFMKCYLSRVQEAEGRAAEAAAAAKEAARQQKIIDDQEYFGKEIKKLKERMRALADITAFKYAVYIEGALILICPIALFLLLRHAPAAGEGAGQDEEVVQTPP